jgi:hypothetical protein
MRCSDSKRPSSEVFHRKENGSQHSPLALCLGDDGKPCSGESHSAKPRDDDGGAQLTNQRYLFSDQFYAYANRRNRTQF